MDDLRRIAYETVLRACGFASLAIFCVMIGLSFLPRSAFQAGGFLTMVMTARPCLQGRRSAHQGSSPHRDVALSVQGTAPGEEFRATGNFMVMRETYFTFARWTAIVSIVMWAIALAFSIAGF